MTITVEIEGVGRVELDDTFRSLSPERQNEVIQGIIGTVGQKKPDQMQATRDRIAQGGGIPEGYFLNPMTGQYTTRDMLARNTDTGALGAVAAGGAHGYTLGGVDELAGGLGAIEGLFREAGSDATAEFRREQARARVQAARRDYPVTTTGSEIAGAVALPMPGGAAVQGMTTMQRAATGAGVGAGFGAQYGFLSGEGGGWERGKSALEGAAVGAVVGGAVPLAVRGASRAIQGVQTGRAMDQAAKTAPTTEALRGQASALYDAARSRGLVIRGDSFKTFADDLANVVKAEGADPQVTSAAYGAVRRLEALAKGAQNRPVSLRDLDILRKISGNAGASANPADQRIAGMITEGIDDYVTRLVDGDLVAGSAKGLSEELTQARSLWRAMRNSEMIERAVDKAKDQASGFENGIRIQFRQILRNPRLSRSLTEGEREAMRAVVQGTVVGNTLKRLSRLGFGTGAQTSMLSGGLATGAGASLGSAVGGPIGAAVGAAVPAVVGGLSSRGAERVTLGLAERARAVAASGGLALPPAPPLNRLAVGLERSTQGAVPSWQNLRR